MMAMVQRSGVRFGASFAVLKIQNGRRFYTLPVCRVSGRECLDGNVQIAALFGSLRKRVDH